MVQYFVFLQFSCTTAASSTLRSVYPLFSTQHTLIDVSHNYIDFKEQTDMYRNMSRRTFTRFSSRSRCAVGYRSYSFRRWPTEIIGSISIPKPVVCTGLLIPDDRTEVGEVPEVELETKLHVTGVDLHIADNAKAHHTDRYECNVERVRESDRSLQKPELVIRRGQDFKMTIVFDRPYDINKNDIALIFSLGDDYKPNQDLNATFKVDETGNVNYKPKRWGATVVQKQSTSLTLNVFVPAWVPVGAWDFSVRTVVDNKDGEDVIWQYNHNEEINIIFNPWCKEDWVYLEDDTWRNEAVLNDMGALYLGSYDRMGSKPWYFGQFEDGILDAAFYFVRKCFGFRASPRMGNAATVARFISKIINSNDDNGVLVGRWGKGPYPGGTQPGKWGGSVKILRQYMDTGKPVKYGQCWVFSGLVTTVCRALGLPCRSITNFSSAHNADKNRLSVDKLKRQTGDGGWTIEDTSDSIWNFHVWNEVWMSRPDLSDAKKWDGWQVIDATPQETSDNVFCCGPAPVKAIKQGEITVGKDGDFVFSEVNADTVIWTVDPTTGKWSPVKRITSSVGKNMSTRQPTGRVFTRSTDGRYSSSDLQRLDVTDDYKYREGTPKEREIVGKAERVFTMMHSGRTEDVESDDGEYMPEPLKIDIEDPGDVFVGTVFDFVVHVKNVTSLAVAVRDVTIKVYYKTYDDCITGLATMKKSENFNLKSGRAETFKLEMTEKLTLVRPQDSYIFELVADASIKNSYKPVTENLVFRLRRPDVITKGPETCRGNTNIDVEVCFTNPLSIPLTHCEIDLDGQFTCISRKTDTFRIPDIGPGQTWRETLTICPKVFPRDKKDRQLSIGLDSIELQEIIGYYAVELN